jgi:hypothetical protein
MVTRLISVKIKKVRNLVLALILFSTLFVGMVGQQLVQAWMLTIDLSEAGDFGDDRVCGSVRGQYGYYDYLCTDNGPYAEISFDIPNAKIPVDSRYVVCSWSNSLGSTFFKDCNTYKHGDHDAEVSQEDLIR